MKKLLFSLAILTLISSTKVFGTYSIQSFIYDWCTSPYPSTYVMSSFKLQETDYSGNNGNDGFTKGQTNKYMDIILSAGAEFKISKPYLATITSSSAEVIIDSFRFEAANRLRIWITTSANNTIKDVISFNNFEIRAMYVSAPRMYRSGGTFKVDNFATRPTTSENFANFSAKVPFLYTSSAVDHPSFNNINQYTINNTMLRIRISGNGNCGSNVTQFNFSTDGNNGTGTDSVRNITTAKVYYTGNSTTFSTATYFGQFVLPNGDFTITGNQGLINGANYFWLVYDVPGDANTSPDANRLDASLVSFVLKGNTITNMTTPSPTGYRKVVPSEFYYSKFTGNWTDNGMWAVFDNGPTCNCQPNGGGIVVIDTGHIVTMNKSRIVDVTWIMEGASLNGQNSSIKFITNTDLTTSGNGFFYFLGDITVRGNVTLNGTGTSEFHKVDSIGGDLYVGPQATYRNMAASTFDVCVGGNVIVKGSLINTQANVVMYGGSTNIDGTGYIQTSNFVIKNGDKTVKPSADLYVDAGFIIEGGYKLDNFGKMNIRGNMDGTDDLSQWINETGSDLSYGGQAIPFFTNGFLDARADSNIVRYSGVTDQTLAISRDEIYYDLALEASGIKYMVGDVHLHGDFYFNATLGHGSRTVTVDGARMQYFTGSVSPTMYNVTMDNSLNGLTLQLPVKYAGRLTLNSGKIFTTATNLLTANDNATATSGQVISFVHGPMQKIGNDVFDFPVGKNDRWARIGISAPLSDATSFVAEYFDDNFWDTTSVTAPLDHVSTQEYWNLKGTAKATEPVTVKLFWENGATFSGINEYSTDFVVAGWSGTSWMDRGQSAITGSDPGNITSNIVNVFDAFTFGAKKRNGNPLPINLLNFDAKLNNGVANIFWTTQTEINNDYFTVEKSIDAVDFQTLTKVKGAGNSNETLHYQTNDYKPYDGVTYYRLKQTDFDGNFTYSKIAEVIYAKDLANDINIYPNPFSSTLNFSINVISDGNDAELSITNMMGVEVIHKTIAGKLCAIDTEMLPQGVYTYEISINFQIVKTGKLVKQ